jgi:uncharacterized protein YycO
LALQTTPLENDPARVLHFDFNRFQNLVNHFSRAAFYNSRNLCYNARRGVENVHSLFRSWNVNAKRRTVTVVRAPKGRAYTVRHAASWAITLLPQHERRFYFQG